MSASTSAYGPVAHRREGRVVEHPTVGDERGDVRLDLDLLHAPQGVGRCQHVRRRVGDEGVQRGGVLEAERADAEPPQRRQVCVTTERGAEVGGEGAHVGAARALDEHRRVREPTRRERLELVAVDPDGSRRTLDLLALASELVQAPAVDLERGDHRWDLLDVADERVHRGADLGVGDRHLVAGELVARGIERARRHSERHDAAVRLRGLLQEPHEARDAAEADEQDASGIGVQRARMTDPTLPGRAAELRHNIVARPARRLVDDEETVDHLTSRSSTV